MNTSSKTPGLFRRLTYKIPIFRSLKAYIFLLMLIIGIVPSDIMRLGILNNYEERAVNLRGSDVASQYRIIANHLVNYNYLQNPTSDVVNAELEQMSNLYDGRAGSFCIPEEAVRPDGWHFGKKTESEKSVA